MCLITGVFQVKNSTKRDQAVSRFNIWVMVDYAVVRQTHRHWMVQRVLMSRACACVCVCVCVAHMFFRTQVGSKEKPVCSVLGSGRRTGSSHTNTHKLLSALKVDELFSLSSIAQEKKEDTKLGSQI